MNIFTGLLLLAAIGLVAGLVVLYVGGALLATAEWLLQRVYHAVRGTEPPTWWALYKELVAGDE